ncbi:serine/threonine protein kinase [Acaryochloris thomasi]|nr:serine/threonine-protein kinase [Acaryochloris thomasi]
MSTATECCRSAARNPLLTVRKVTHPSICQSNPLLGRSIGDHHRYRLETQLGKGGMGHVYQATDTRLGKTVAVKLLNPSLKSDPTTTELDFKRRFERECAICAALTNENIVQVSDYGMTPEGQPFYVMEHLEGQTLEQVLKQETKLSVERTKQIMKQVCAGLRSAHEGVRFKTPQMETDECIKIIHRDLKPANIFLVPTELGERVKVIDFGIAKVQSLNLENMTLASSFLGTHHYSAPEQFDSQGQLDERADIYCLGIILYEMLTGADPFGLKTREQRVAGESWIKAHLLKPAQPLRSQVGCEHLPPGLERIVERCLEKHPDRRFPSVKALAQALDIEHETLPNSLVATSRKNLAGMTQTLSEIPVHFQQSESLAQVRQWLQAHLKRAVSPIQSKAGRASSHSLNDLSLSSKLSIVNSQLIERCRTELAFHIGPIASLVIEQALINRQYQQPKKFIEVLSHHIPDDDTATHFRRTLLSPTPTQLG